MNFPLRTVFATFPKLWYVFVCLMVFFFLFWYLLWPMVVHQHFFFFFLLGHIWGKWKFPGQSSNLGLNSNPNCSSENARSLTHWATEKLQKHLLKLHVFLVSSSFCLYDWIMAQSIFTKKIWIWLLGTIYFCHFLDLWVYREKKDPTGPFPGQSNHLSNSAFGIWGSDPHVHKLIEAVNPRPYPSNGILSTLVNVCWSCLSWRKFSL